MSLFIVNISNFVYMYNFPCRVNRVIGFDILYALWYFIVEDRNEKIMLVGIADQNI